MDVSKRFPNRNKVLRNSLLALFWAAICVLAFFGGNFKDDRLRQLDFLWWFLSIFITLISRRYLKRKIIYALIALVACSAAVGIITTKDFYGIKYVEWFIDAYVAAAMFLLSRLRLFSFVDADRTSVVKCVVLSLCLTVIAMGFVFIAAFFASSFVTVASMLFGG